MPRRDVRPDEVKAWGACCLLELLFWGLVIFYGLSGDLALTVFALAVLGGLAGVLGFAVYRVIRLWQHRR